MADAEELSEDLDEEGWPVPDPPEGGAPKGTGDDSPVGGAGESAFLLNLISPDARRGLLPLADLDRDALLEAFLSGGAKPAQVVGIGLSPAQTARLSPLSGAIFRNNHPHLTAEAMGKLRQAPPNLLLVHAEGDNDPGPLLRALGEDLGYRAPLAAAVVDGDDAPAFRSPPSWARSVLALSWPDPLLELHLRQLLRHCMTRKDIEMIFLAHRVGREQLHKVTFTDPLTGLMNRAGFHDASALELGRIVRTQGTLGLLILDIDRFKSVNDTYGHPVGDSVLREIAHILRLETRSLDHVIRFGGEEFGVILPHTDYDEIVTVAERIRAHVERHHFEFIPKAGDITISIGALCVGAGRRPTMDDVYPACDELLYEAKQTGRNRVVASHFE